MVNIKGVVLKKLEKHVDERGYFQEILRDDDSLFKNLKNFGQISISSTKPGIIKAFHWHEQQDDIFYVISGSAKVVLYDLREESTTYKHVDELDMNDNDQKLLFVPRKVAHGYKVLGKKDLVMLYIMNKPYNRKKPDEQRIPLDDKNIGIDWFKYK